MKEILKKIKNTSIVGSTLWSIFVYIFLLIGIILMLLGFYVFPINKSEGVNHSADLPLGITGICMVVVGLVGYVLTIIIFRKKLTKLINELDYFRNDFVTFVKYYGWKPFSLSMEIYRKASYFIKNYDELIRSANIKEESSENNEQEKEVILETERLLLRKFKDKDLDIVYKYRNDEDCKKYQSFSAFSKPEIKGLFERNKKASLSRQGDSLFGIAKLDDDTLVGEIYTSRMNDEIYLGFTIAPEHQRQGYAFEMLTDLIVKISLEIPSIKIFCSIFPNNERSINLVKKLGFKMIKEVNDLTLGKVYIFQFQSVLDNKKQKDNKVNENKKEISKTTISPKETKPKQSSTKTKSTASKTTAKPKTTNNNSKTKNTKK